MRILDADGIRSRDLLHANRTLYHYTTDPRLLVCPKALPWSHLTRHSWWDDHQHWVAQYTQIYALYFYKFKSHLSTLSMSTKSKLKFPKLNSQVIYNTFFHILCLKHLLLQSISVHSYGFVPEPYILLISILHIVSNRVFIY